MMQRRFRLGFLLLAIFAASCARPASGPRELTFYVISDLHYNWPAPGDAALQRAAIAELNGLAGQSYPQKIGGTVAAPRGVIVVGDLAESTANNAEAAWEADFGLTGEKLLKYPVYEGLGNHDQRGPSAWDMVARRNRQRPGVRNISANGYHYSWDWEGVHFVQLNLCAANGPDPVMKNKSDARGALDFLTADLKKNVGDSGRPVIVCQHFDLRQTGWWSEAQKEAFAEAVKPYNLACLVQGHTHSATAYQWHGLDIMDDGAVKNEKRDSKISSFLVFHISGDKMTVLQRMVGGKWGRVDFEKKIAEPAIAQN